MAELDVRAGEDLERTMARYARLRLEPTAAQVKRARGVVMEAAWRQHLALPAATAQPRPDVAILAAPRRHGPFAGWGVRRLGGSLAAAVLAGLLVGSTAFAGSRAGGPLYATRVAIEELTLPADGPARLEAEIALAQGRLAEIVEGVAKHDDNAVVAATRAYLTSVDELGASTGGPADRAFAAVQQHLAVLEEVLRRAPAEARSGIERAITHSSTVADTLKAAGAKGGGTPSTNGTGGNGNGTGGNGSGSGGNGNGGVDGQPAATPVTGNPDRTPKPDKTPKPVATETPKPGGKPSTPPGRPTTEPQRPTPTQ